MPKQFKNSKKILAATVLTTSLAVAPIISNADTNQTAEPVEGPTPVVTSGEPSAVPGMPTIREDGTTEYKPVTPGEPAADPDQPADSQLPADLADPEVYEDEHGNKVYDYSEEDLDAGIGQPAEEGEGPVVSTPTVDEFGNTAYEQGDLNPDAGQPAEPGEGPIVSMPTVDEKGNTIYGKYNKTSATKVSKVSKVSTNQNLNPKTGDSSMIGYVGLGLSSALGLFRKRK